MKIGIISDAHLFHKWAITPEQYHNILVNNFKNCDIIVDCGDLTDRSNLTAPQIDALSKVYDGVHMPIYIVAGNHDSLSSTTVASMFDSKENVVVVREPTVIDDMLFIPYTDDIKTMFKQLNNLIDEPVNYAFSHLNITSNIYATIPFSDTKKLHNYAKYFFNGHIHADEKKETIYGTVYNVGACSSLTFGDSHVPCYSIFDTETDYLDTQPIDGSIVHKNFKVTDNSSLQQAFSEINYATRFYKMRCKFYLPNCDESIEYRKKIKEYSEQNPSIISIVFDYIKIETKQEVKKKQETQTVESKKISLMEQLFKHFEEDNQVILNEDIKKELMS